ncbi:hypothetical protein BN14_01926 [Rhizoctonia solani AG-1 IB]|uniref:Uncharacterized protein n=1 Tax=Thanatephorus cucumeris (strain AG1-IB / isolate 7/3/14) TaxID=1108050 RepID=M5BM49_THACB|nr:hypothetical protein BN14_01926 [Rhizoctonia solani AG-1 IB]
MFKLTRAFVVAAVLSSSVLCAPIPKDTGKPISTNQSADPSAHASRVFGTTSQDPNYQTHPTTLCVVPAMAKDAGLSQGQEELTVKQAIELCQEVNTIAVSSKSPKRSRQVREGSAPVPFPVHEPQPDAQTGTPHPVRSVDGQPSKVGDSNSQPALSENLPGAPQPSPEPVPGAPHQVGTRSPKDPSPNPQVPPQSKPLPPHPVPSPIPGASQSHVIRDIPPQAKPIPEPVPVPIPQSEAPRPVAPRSPQALPPNPRPVEGAPAPRIPAARSEGQPHPALQPQPTPEPAPQPGAFRPHVARSEPPQVPHPDAKDPHKPVLQPGAPLPAEH